ncbi:hypothetical protein HYC85_009001 [Camellia sinensis]|uniref:Protein kinase domain-containing protein n=1 Tax=Camellia sinensis TaxID=4442 RepID=A0A7J7HUG8_CAMSI|nr:hypothetical protein HYC85_009001 [Camellia sinensis]
MHFLLTTLKVVYVLTNPYPVEQEDETMEQTRTRTKWKNDDYICQGHILNTLSDSLFDTSKIHMVDDGKRFNKKKHKRDPQLEKDAKKLIGACWHCGKVGHFRNECRSYKKKQEASNAKNKFVAVVSEVNMLEDAGDWWVDLGATRHVCNDKSRFTTYEQVSDGIVLYTGNSSTATIKGKWMMDLECKESNNPHCHLMIEQDALPTFPDAEAFSCIERELGISLDSIYSSISPSPIAAASLGQVYKAQLKYSGQIVAVKVQRPGIEEAIGLDFYLIRGLGFLINKYVDIISSDVVALIDEFARRVYQELNYVQEGQNARRFKKLYADKEEVLVPDIFWDYTSGKVLTMEWVEGVKLNEQDAIERQGLNVLESGEHMLLEYGYFHADPHPGNLLATPEGKLAFLDFGMMSETPEEARSAIIGHVVHMVNRDYEAMARDYYALDFLSPDVDVSPIVPALQNFFDDALNSTVSELNFKTLVDGLGAVLYQYPFNVPAYYALILRSLTVLEGLALYADPNFKVLAASYPYFAKRLLTDPNPYLRDALIELLFKDGKWNRLENLLVQGKKDRDFSAKDALQPVLKLLLGPNGKELRALVIKEAVRVTEAVILGSVIDTYNSVPSPMRTLMFNANSTGPLIMSDAEQSNIMELRAQMFRIWGLLRSSENFDPTVLQPILQVLQEPEARSLGGRVIGGITQRLAARLLQQVLRVPTTPTSTS